MELAYDFDTFRRRSERKEYQAEVSFAAGSLFFPANLENISTGGAMLTTKNLPLMKIGSEVALTIPFALKKGYVKKRGTVMWAEDGYFGIQFI